MAQSENSTPVGTGAGTPRAQYERPADRATAEPRGEKGYYGSGFLFVLGAMFLALYVLPKLLGSGSASATPAGASAPAFQVDYISHAPEGAASVSLDTLKGKVVLLDFWATWCGPCRAEAPVINRVYAKYKDRATDVAFVGINTDDRDLATEFVHAKRLEFPMAFDSDGSAGAAFRVESLPTLVVLTRSGKISFRRSGTLSEADLERVIEKALSEP